MRKSAIAKRSIVVGGRKTSVSLENAFWLGLKEIAATRNSTLSEVVTEVGLQRQYLNLSSQLRLLVLDHYRSRASGPTAAIVASRPPGDHAGAATAGAG
jgi:predicted DNA-binding ribbon-helix-helix protein